MKVECPQCTNLEFFASATVSESWLVDETGEYLATIEYIQTIHKPDPDNIWHCSKCNSVATVINK